MKQLRQHYNWDGSRKIGYEAVEDIPPESLRLSRMHAYRCDICDLFHIGHQPLKKQHKKKKIKGHWK